mgnify:CR=1 FL=1
MSELYVAKVEELADHERRIVVEGDLEIGVFRVGDGFFAWENNCPHAGGPVCQGRVMNRVNEVLDDEKRAHGYEFVEDDVHIICPWHGYEFNIRSGAHPGEPNTQLRGFPVEVRGGAVYVRI